MTYRGRQKRTCLHTWVSVAKVRMGDLRSGRGNYDHAEGRVTHGEANKGVESKITWRWRRETACFQASPDCTNFTFLDGGGQRDDRWVSLNRRSQRCRTGLTDAPRPNEH